MDSFPQFKRCSLAQWRGYPDRIRERMEAEGGWFMYDRSSEAIKGDSLEFPLWVVEQLPPHQGTLIKVILE